jgi:hypothetical protein
VGHADPHIHVDVKLAGDAAGRHRLASTFGLVGDLPTTVTTGCAIEAPLAMTSGVPENVTCLACREFAGREHRRRADQIEHLGRMAGSPLTPAQASGAAEEHRGLARRFGVDG